MSLAYDLTIPLLGIYTRETKTCVYTKIYLQMFVTAFFLITETTLESFSAVWVNCGYNGTCSAIKTNE
jgi:hypothetical protein